MRHSGLYRKWGKGKRREFQLIANYSKSQIFVQKFNFDKKKPNIFTRFSSKKVLTIFLLKSKLSTAKMSKTTSFWRVFRFSPYLLYKTPSSKITQMIIHFKGQKSLFCVIKLWLWSNWCRAHHLFTTVASMKNAGKFKSSVRLFASPLWYSTKCGRISGVERANIFHMGSKYMMMITTIISIMVFPQVGPKAHSFAGVA